MIEAFSWVVGGNWGAPAALRISQALLTISVSIILALLLYRMTTAGIEAVVGKITSLSELFYDIGSLVVRATVLIFVVSQWPTFTTYIRNTPLELSSVVLGSTDSPESIAKRALSTLDRYQSVMQGSDDIWSREHGMPQGANPDKGSIPPGSVSLDSFTLNSMMIFVVNKVSWLIVMLISGVVVSSMVMPMLLMYIALAVAPLAIAARMSDDKLSIQFSSGWQTVLLVSMLSAPILMIIISIMGPSLTNPPQMLIDEPSFMGRLTQISHDLPSLLLMATFLAMPMPIAYGITRGQLPTVNPALMLLALVGRVVKGFWGRLSRVSLAGRK